MGDKKIGEIVHYFSGINVGIIKLTDSLEVGEKIRVVGGEDTDFTQEITSMEVEHEKIEKAKKGQEVGIKLEGKVREGYEVYKA